MINKIATRIALTLLTGIATVATADAAYQTIQERQAAALEQYQALIQKWNTALNNPSDETMSIVIKQKSDVLYELYKTANNEYDVNMFKGLGDSLKALPLEFMCNELDADIQAIFTLQHTARTLNMEDTFDAAPFQKLRIAIDTLPSMIAERHACNQMGSMYKYVLALAGGVLVAHHFSLIPVSTPSNA